MSPKAAECAIQTWHILVRRRIARIARKVETKETSWLEVDSCERTCCRVWLSARWAAVAMASRVPSCVVQIEAAVSRSQVSCLINPSSGARSAHMQGELGANAGAGEEDSDGYGAWS